MSLLDLFSLGRRPQRPQSSPPGLEPLEGRTLFAAFAADSVPGLVAAVRAANATPAADTITLAAGKVFTLTAADNAARGPTGLPVVTAPLTVVGNGGVIERSPAVGTLAFRLLDVNAGASLTLKNLTLRNGVAIGRVTEGTAWTVADISAHGGAVRSEGALTLDRVVVENNTARGTRVSSTLTRSFWTRSASGGGVYSTGALVATGSTFRGNAATGHEGGFASGGALYVAAGTATISGCAIAANTARGGDGANGTYSWGSFGSYAGSGAGGHGGAATGGGIYAAGATVTVSSSSVTSNSARGGKGGYGLNAPAGNGGDAFGGGIFAGRGTLTLRGIRVAANAVAHGSGGGFDGLNGKGVGGGLYVDAAATARLDAYTRSNVVENIASTGNRNIFGSTVAIT